MRIFLSSTYQDLIEHRRTTVDALHRLGQQVGCMELLGARPEEPVAACWAEIDTCDLFVGVYAFRYGYIPQGSEASITEQEFERARSRGTPVFCFMAADGVDWPPDHVDPEPTRRRLQALKNRIRRELVVDVFVEPLDLAVKVATAVGRYLIANPRLLSVPVAARPDDRQGLIALLEMRKDHLLDWLRPHPDLSQRFLQLHARNVAAISQGELLISHLLTNEIHTLLAIVKEHLRSRDSLGSSVYDPISISQPEAERLYPRTGESTKPVALSLWAPEMSPSEVRDFARTVEPEGGDWRTALLEHWVHSEASAMKTALDALRLSARLDQEAATRGVMTALLQPGGYALCGHCDTPFTPGNAGSNHEHKCPRCHTRLLLASQIETEEWNGHRFDTRQICERCGCSRGMARHLSLKCRASGS